MAEERRTFLRNGWNWIRLAATAALCYPLFRFVKFKAPKKPRLVKVEKLLKVGDVYLDQEFVLFHDESDTWAVSRICTHLGCRLNFSEKEHLLICPCHQSMFTTKGVMLAGPAKRNLPLFAVEKMSGENAKGFIVSL
ncbi:MAG: Rieske 2Fe-2S domain-containing protein [Desulfobulbaceae bacterium]|nr:Rieske 2Fe-2S domain-containing protein [Desulfobulbaceae bacterium]